MITFPERLADLAAGTPQATALCAGEEAVDFESLQARVLRQAAAVRGLGVQPGERVGIWLQKGIDQAVLLLAVLEANAVVVPIHTSFTARQVAEIAADSQIRLLIVDPLRAAPLADLPSSCRLMVAAGAPRGAAESFEETAGSLSGPQPSRYTVGPDANAVILYTARWREPLLGLVLSHADLVLRGERTARHLDLSSDDRVSGIVCLNLAFGLDQLWGTLTAGAALYPHAAIFSNDAFDFIELHGLTVLPLLQVTAARLFSPRLYSPSGSRPKGGVRRITVTGGKTATSTLDSLAKQFPEARIELLYGVSEAGSVASQSVADEHRHPGTVGTPLPGIDLLLLDEDGARCPRGAEGELALRGASVSRGYWNNPGATARGYRCLDPESEARTIFTGDGGRLVPDTGRIELTGRRDGTIKSHGHRISPIQVERAVCDCDDVGSAIAFRAPNAEIGEDIVVVYSTDTREPLDEGSLSASLASRLPRFMLPRWFVHQCDLPTLEGASTAVRNEIARRAGEELGVEVR